MTRTIETGVTTITGTIVRGIDTGAMKAVEIETETDTSLKDVTATGMQAGAKTALQITDKLLPLVMTGRGTLNSSSSH